MAGTNEFAPQMKIEKQVPDGLGKIHNSRLVALPNMWFWVDSTSPVSTPLDFSDSPSHRILKIIPFLKNDSPKAERKQHEKAKSFLIRSTAQGAAMDQARRSALAVARLAGVYADCPRANCRFRQTARRDFRDRICGGR